MKDSIDIISSFEKSDECLDSLIFTRLFVAALLHGLSPLPPLSWLGWARAWPVECVLGCSAFGGLGGKPACLFSALP